MNRIKKIEIDLQREISFIINTKVKDPRVGFVTVTYVKLSSDYHYMDVYITVMNKEANLKTCLEGLNKCRGFIKKNLLERIKLKIQEEQPDLKFSVGIAQVAGKYDLTELFQLANVAIHKAKDKGKDQIVVWEEGMPTSVKELQNG